MNKYAIKLIQDEINTLAEIFCILEDKKDPHSIEVNNDIKELQKSIKLLKGGKNAK